MYNCQINVKEKFDIDTSKNRYIFLRIRGKQLTHTHIHIHVYIYIFLYIYIYIYIYIYVCVYKLAFADRINMKQRIGDLEIAENGNIELTCKVTYGIALNVTIVWTHEEDAMIFSSEVLPVANDLIEVSEPHTHTPARE